MCAEEAETLRGLAECAFIGDIMSTGISCMVNGRPTAGNRVTCVQRWIEAQLGHLLSPGGGLAVYVDCVVMNMDDERAGDEMQLLWDLLVAGHTTLASYLYALMVRASCWAQTAGHDRDACVCGRCYAVRRLDELHASARAEIAAIDDDGTDANWGNGMFAHELDCGPLARDDLQYESRSGGEWLERRFASGTWSRFRGVLVGDIAERSSGGCALELQAVLSTPEHVLAPVLMLWLMYNQILHGREILHVKNVVYGPGPDDTSGVAFWTFWFRHGVCERAKTSDGLMDAEKDASMRYVQQTIYDSHVPRMLDYAKERVERCPRERFGWGYLHLVGGLRVYADGLGRTRNVEQQAMQHFDASFASSAYGRTHWTPRLHRASPGLMLTSRGDAYVTVGRVPRAMLLVIAALLAGAQRLSDVGVLPADLGDRLMWEAIFESLERGDFWDA